MRKYILIILFGIWFQNAWAQNQDPLSPGFDFNATQDSSGQMGDGIADTEEGDQVNEKTPVKPYERIVLNMDSITNLIVYTAVVEQDESSSDSLYVRSKRFAQQYLSGAKGVDKALYEVDKKNQKLVINGQLTAYAYSSKYSKNSIGKYYFKMTILYKEGRYKYSITNFVHEAEKPNSGTPARNYFEYYYTTTTGIRKVDQLLRFADKDITKMLVNFTKAMKEPMYLDEDEW